MTRCPAGEGPSVVEALNQMLAAVEMPIEAAPDIALAIQTARRIDAFNVMEGYAPVANSLVKQLAVLRQWIRPPEVTEEDPFDALARRLGVDVANGGPDDAG